MPQCQLFDEILRHSTAAAKSVLHVSCPIGTDDHHLYLGTSGISKGVFLTIGNVGHMLDCTSARLDLLMEGGAGRI